MGQGYLLPCVLEVTAFLDLQPPDSYISPRSPRPAVCSYISQKRKLEFAASSFSSAKNKPFDVEGAQIESLDRQSICSTGPNCDPRG